MHATLLKKPTTWSTAEPRAWVDRSIECQLMRPFCNVKLRKSKFDGQQGSRAAAWFSKKVFSQIASACGAGSSINAFFLLTFIEPLWIEGTEIAFVWVRLSGIYAVLQTAFVTWFHPHSRIASIVVHSFHILIISDYLMLRPVLSSKEFRQPYEVSVGYSQDFMLRTHDAWMSFADWDWTQLCSMKRPSSSKSLPHFSHFKGSLGNNAQLILSRPVFYAKSR